MTELWRLMCVTSTVVITGLLLLSCRSDLGWSLNLLEMVEAPGLETNYVKVEAVQGDGSRAHY